MPVKNYMSDTNLQFSSSKNVSTYSYTCHFNKFLMTKNWTAMSEEKMFIFLVFSTRISGIKSFFLVLAYTSTWNTNTWQIHIDYHNKRIALLIELIRIMYLTLSDQNGIITRNKAAKFKKIIHFHFNTKRVA